MKIIKGTSDYPFFNDHDAYELEYNGEKVIIDIKLAPLIQEIWKANLKIRFCCQGYDHKLLKKLFGYYDRTATLAYISFESISDLNKFIRIIKKEINDILKEEMKKYWIIEKEYKCIRFPKKKIKFITRILGKYNNRKNEKL